MKRRDDGIPLKTPPAESLNSDENKEVNSYPFHPFPFSIPITSRPRCL